MRKLKLQELGRLTPKEYKSAKRMPVVVVMDNIRSAMNVGSVFRTADAFAAESIVLVGITAQPPHREISKTAIGATQSVDWKYCETIAEALTPLKEAGYKVAVIEQTDTSTSLPDWTMSDDEKWVIVMGNEVEGVSEEALALADIAIELPQYGTKHSLNVSVCAGIVLWELNRALY